MFHFSPETILTACNNLNNCPAQVGGIISIISILNSSIEPLTTYSLNNKKLKLKLSNVFDNTPKTDFQEAEAKYIVFSNEWETHFFDTIIKDKIDLLSISVFFMRRNSFTTKLSSNEVIEQFIKENHISPKIRNEWFIRKNDFPLDYNENNIEENQNKFYLARFKTDAFKSITFNSPIQKCAYEFSAAAHIQTLYSGNDIKKSFIYSDVSLSDYYNFQGINHLPTDKISFSRNRIIFGAPGTGKSHRLQEEQSVFNQNVERVTFHPNYSYSQFVGTYKPITQQVTNLNDEQKEILSTLLDKSKSAQEKYDLLYNVFKGESLTRLPILIGLYDDGLFHTKKTDGTPAANDNMVERNHGKAIRPYVNIENIHKEEITYEYVPGPFIRTFIKAEKTGQNVLLLIEEINRANVAAVFGDVFQLLDRNSEGTSEYSITTSEDLRKFLAKPENLGGSPDDYKTISIPSNMYIWATMNSADQGVLPMDAAFKRRWDFEYINIDDGASEIEGVSIPIPNGKNEDGSIKYESIEWNELRSAINGQLKKVSGINEDKLLGPFFIGDKTKIENAAKNEEQFCKSFKSKVLMYLFEDVVKMQPCELFESKDGSNIHYSDICKEFDNNGLKIFVKSIYEKFPEFKDGDAE